MPEGDTIHRVALTLRQALVGRTLTRVELPRVPAPHPSVGATITGVEARGKHLLVHSDDGLTVHTHLRMTGSWHRYGPGERWRKPARSARVVLAVGGTVAVCFSAPIVEVLDTPGLRRHPSLRALGPDLCDPEADLDEATRRLDRLRASDLTIGEVLLDQRVACGIGNVYRCDVLFLHGLDPATPLRRVDPSTARALLEDAGRLLRANLGGGARTTVPALCHADRGAPPRRAGPLRLPVSPVPALPRPGIGLTRMPRADYAA